VGFLNRRQAQFGEWMQPWLDKGYHGEMKWLERHREIRRDPCSILEGGQSIISMAFPFLTSTPQPWSGERMISSYAWGEDYHVVLKKRLRKALEEIRTIIPRFEGRVFVDSAPLPEKIIAAACGVGWIGRNSLLISPPWGSFVFLAEIVCNLELTTTQPLTDQCGSCDLCRHACPNQAILADRALDARRCTSYLTIEKQGAYTPAEAKRIHFNLFGCDSCQLVCPWNQQVPLQENSPFACDPKWLKISIRDLTGLSETEFDSLKRKSPVKRLKIDGIRRNALAILANGPLPQDWD